MNTQLSILWLLSIIVGLTFVNAVFTYMVVKTKGLKNNKKINIDVVEDDSTPIVNIISNWLDVATIKSRPSFKQALNIIDSVTENLLKRSSNSNKTIKLGVKCICRATDIDNIHFLSCFSQHEHPMFHEVNNLHEFFDQAINYYRKSKNDNPILTITDKNCMFRVIVQIFNSIEYDQSPFNMIGGYINPTYDCQLYLKDIEDYTTPIGNLITGAFDVILEQAPINHSQLFMDKYNDPETKLELEPIGFPNQQLSISKMWVVYNEEYPIIYMKAYPKILK